MEFRIGTSGWTYPHWKVVFYPEELPSSRWLDFYTKQFDTVELNASFYRQPTHTTFENWKNKTPSGFVWSVKANRYITHLKKLRNVKDSLKRFYEAASGLDGKLGVILFQLPPSFRSDRDVFAEFITLLPPTYRVAFEFRHASWLCKEIYELLRENNAAFCISDTAGRYPYAEELTADFVYLRLHGSRILYGSDYSEDELSAWAVKIRNWGKSAYVYFDNDYMGYAVQNALRLKEILSA